MPNAGDVGRPRVLEVVVQLGASPSCCGEVIEGEVGDG